MGCATSKQKVCENCQAPRSKAAARSYSMHVHHFPQRPGDSYHVVALTSSTLGSLQLDLSRPESITPAMRAHASFHVREDLSPSENVGGNVKEKISREDMSIEAKKWSNMIEEKIPKFVPKTPNQTPPGEPESINAWELMEGLEDISPIKPPDHLRSFSFHVSANENGGDQSPKPMCLEKPDKYSDLHSDQYDPEGISTFRKTLEELPPANPFHLKPLMSETEQPLMVKDETIQKPELTKLKLVLYFTSLRGVRKTYEDCCHVKTIIKGLCIRVDERDVSMHSGFKEELKELLGEGYRGGGLPKVFVGTKYIGGAEEIRQMHESGRLEKVVAGCERVDDGGGGGGGVCEACGDMRFVPCNTCSGSCKIYYEVDYDDEDEYEEEDCGFQRCPHCNENGLIRCPICCD